MILYCSTGYRTAMGVMALQMLGYDNVRGFPPTETVRFIKNIEIFSLVSHTTKPTL